MGMAKTLFLTLIVAIVLSVGLNYVIAPALTAPGGDGSLNQSPVLYIALLLGVFVVGFVILTLVRRKGTDSKFDFWLFVCVALSGILMGGVIHEFTHVILIQHPTQFRVHFGDSFAVFSTCCLGPGEYHFEEIAYAIQFLVTLGWILAFRSSFYTPGKIKNKKPPKMKRENEEQDEDDSDEEDVDKEWEKAKKSMEGLGVNKNAAKKARIPRKKVALTDEETFRTELGNLDTLKIPPRE